MSILYISIHSKLGMTETCAYIVGCAPEYLLAAVFMYTYTIIQHLHWNKHAIVITKGLVKHMYSASKLKSLINM